MSLDATEHAIYQLATECDSLFQQALLNESAPTYRALLEYHQRFELWCGYLGVLAQPELSLDRRVQFNEDVRRNILELLLLIRTSLSRDLQDDGTNVSSKEVSSFVAKALAPNDSAILQHLWPIAKATLGSVGGALDRLHRVAIAIRRASTDDLFARVQLFKDKPNNEGMALSDALIEVKRSIPEISDSLASQLARSITFRTSRLQYQQRHHRKLSNRRQALQKSEPQKMEKDAPISSFQSVPDAPLAHVPLTREPDPSNPIEPSEVLSVSDYSILNVRKLQQNLSDTQSNASGHSITSLYGGKYAYPRQPKPAAGAETCPCPWCFEELKTSQLEIGGWWRSHFDKDLEPYVCISEDCNDPPQFFSNIKQWFTHMNTVHTTQWYRNVHKSDVWYCDLAHPNKLGLDQFHTSLALEQHLLDEHSTLSPRMISARVRRNHLTVSRPANECPLCRTPVLQLSAELDEKPTTDRQTIPRVSFVIDEIDDDEYNPLTTHPKTADDNSLLAHGSSSRRSEKDENNKQVSQHVAQHLKALAFVSLIWWDEDNFSTESEASSRRLSNASETSVLRSREPSPSGLRDSLHVNVLNLNYPPPSGADEGSDSSCDTAGSSLADRLYERFEKSVFDQSSRQFLPQNALDELINPSSVVWEMLRGLGPPSELLSTDDEGLVEFIIGRAKRLFAISVMVLPGPQSGSTILRDAIRLFRRHYIDDSRLPFDNSGDSILAGLESEERKSKKIWEPRAIRAFHDSQWSIVVPILTTDSRARSEAFNLPANTVLPFIKGGLRHRGPFVSVFEYELHPSHIHRLDRAENSMVAVKEVSHVDLQNDIAQQHWEQEIQALDRLNELKQDHIVRFLAAFSRYRQGGRDFYLIMEWADGGNLRDLWQKYPRPVLNTSLVKASFRELHGLATALLAAHYAENSSISYRHGDLRPENILRFHGIDIIGTLKISDWGEARNISTHSITSHRDTGRLEYGAPEWANHDPSSRLSDIWSMGCIILEFMIWLLYGAEGLERFENELPPGCNFYQLAEDRYGSVPVINTVVVKWMNSMADHFACEPGSALGKLLELVKTGLLVVKLPRQIEMTDETWTIPAVASREDFASPDLPSIVISQSDPVNPQEKSGPALGLKPDPEPSRVTAPEFERIIQGILSQDAATNEYWLPDATTYPAPTQDLFDKKEHQQDTKDLVGQESVVTPTERDVTSPRPERVDYLAPQISNNWEFQIDNEFPTKLYTVTESHMAMKHQEIPGSKLCTQCQSVSERTFQLDFVESYGTGDLQGRATNNICDLCALLWKTCLRSGCCGGKIVRFRRVGSVLLIDERTFPVLSIVCGPKLMPTLDTPDPYDGIQIGLPKLPDPGSPAYVSILKQWLQDCDSGGTHFTCESLETHIATGALPTRLIEILGTSIRLVETSKTNDKSTVAWTALSYIWGTHEVFQTTTNNLALRQAPFPVSSLPRTYQDAVAITRELGLRYLWIDTLCIIQDAAEDWAAEGQGMETVFGKAYCVLAASRATSSQSGFLGPRKPREFVALREPRLNTSFYICEMIDDFRADVLDAPLNSRAWYMQERALARRTIYFTERQTYWECGVGIRCETMTRMRNDQEAILGDPNFPNYVLRTPSPNWIYQVQSIYEKYSQLQVANIIDRPKAIDPLERRILRALGAQGGFGVIDDVTIAGTMHMSLLWRRDPNMGTKGLIKIPFSADSSTGKIPSWSWMAYMGSIVFLEVDFSGIYWEQIRSPSFNSSRESNASGIQAEAQRSLSISRDTSLQKEHIFMDDPYRQDLQLTADDYYVVLGIEGGDVPVLEKKHYVLIARQKSLLSKHGDGGICERIGVGIIPGRYLSSTRFYVEII